MSGEQDLNTLLRSMSATLIEGTFVFATLPDGEVPQTLTPRMIFHEAEGTTLILLKEEAEAIEMPYEFPSRMITLNIHSALDAVGFIAVIATKLAQAGMGVNPVAGFFHDHLFVPEDRVDDAMAILASISAEAKSIQLNAVFGRHRAVHGPCETIHKLTILAPSRCCPFKRVENWEAGGNPALPPQRCG